MYSIDSAGLLIVILLGEGDQMGLGARGEEVAGVVQVGGESADAFCIAASSLGAGDAELEESLALLEEVGLEPGGRHLMVEGWHGVKGAQDGDGSRIAELFESPGHGFDAVEDVFVPVA